MSDETVDMRLVSRECPECGQRFSRDGVFCPFDGTRLEGLSVSLSIDPLMGSTIDGRYEVIELLGEGGMGRVYSVLHTGLGRLFALKALRRELARDEELSQRFIREAKAMASVRHPHIVEITDFGRLPDNVPYFVMEMLVGETLAQVIKDTGCVPVARGIPILEQVASALAAAHEAGVVHRDLKPENIFLVGSGKGRDADGTSPASSGRGRNLEDDVRVVDFGAAKIIGSSQVTRNGVVFGTPYYMSPEQASGAQVDTRTDIYSLGVIMYEMFTGKVPFEGDTYMNVLTQHIFAEPDYPSVRSPMGTSLGALDQVTLTCMAKKPEKRFASMEDVLLALKAVAAGQSDVVPKYAALSGADTLLAMSPDEESRDTGPSLAEIRRAVEEAPSLPPPVPWGWIAVAAIGIGSSLGALVWALSHRAAQVAEPQVAVVPSSTALAPPAIAPVDSRPTVVAESAAVVAPGSSSLPQEARTATAVRPRARPAASTLAPTPHPAPQGIDDVSDPFRGR
jgi:serine/threonine-protein kinase